MADEFESYSVGRESPAEGHLAITPSDTPLTDIPKAIYVGGAGTLVMQDKNAVDVTYTVLAGAIIPFRPTIIKAASTATGIVAWYE